jgi:hypothetical protein
VIVEFMSHKIDSADLGASMFRLLSSSSPLLSTVVQFVHTKEFKLSAVASAIQDCSLSELLPAFAFLRNWLANRPDNEDLVALQDPLRLFGLMGNRLPPVVLLALVFDLNWEMTEPHWLVSELSAPVIKRLVRLRSYLRPPSMFMDFVPLETSLPTPVPDFAPFPNSMIELETDMCHERDCRIAFEKMLLNHMPVESFRALFHYGKARSALTRAIIHLLLELNQTRSAKHEELAFGFSALFLYVHVFSGVNEIDGEELCLVLQSLPFLSPFCMLAIANHLPPNLFMFNLLRPRAIARGHNMEGAPDRYVLIDLAPEKRLSKFLDRVPEIAENYFGSIQPSGAIETSSHDDDDKFLCFVHLSGMSLYNRMKSVLIFARERPVTCFHVCTMGISLLRCISHSLQRTLVDCLSQNVYTTTFCSFIQSVLGILSPTFATHLGQKFMCIFQVPDTMPTVDLTLRAMFHQAMHLLLASPVNNIVIQFCMNACRGPRTVSPARLLLCKLFQCDRPKLSPQILSLVEETEDGLLILDFLDAMTAPFGVQSIAELEQIHSHRQLLMSRLNLTLDDSHPDVFLFETVSLDKRRPSPLTSLVLTGIEQVSKTRPGRDIHDLLRKMKDLSWMVLRALSLSHYVKSRPVADLLVSELCRMLRERLLTDAGPASRFDMRPCDLALPVAEGLLGRLLVVGFRDLALKLVTDMAPVLADDPAPLHWIVMFTSRYLSVVPPDIRRILFQLVESLPGADTMVVIGEDRIYRLVDILVARERPLIRDPEIINREYPSPIAHAHAFAHCCLSLSSMDDAEVARIMAEPLFTPSRMWKDREAASLCLARLAASMCHEIAFQWFQTILRQAPGKLALSAARLFMARARLPVVRKICLTCTNITSRDSIKLDYFLRIVTPSCHRLAGSDSPSVALLCGLCESVGPFTPRWIQETVIDIVTFLYIKLKLRPARSELISAAANFHEDLRLSMQSSLEMPCFDT